METTTLLIVLLLSALFLLVTVLAIFFLNHRSPTTRNGSHNHIGSVGSSNRSRMAARWANMEQGTLGGRGKAFLDEPEDEPEQIFKRFQSQQDHPNDFGTMERFATRRSAPSHGSLSGSLVGTGPNGTRTFLNGWFGLDEPTHSGFNTSSDEREKSQDGHALAMRAPNGTRSNKSDSRVSVIPHQRLPLTDDHDWETRSANSL
ncbi:hypothetical protein O181_062567 [Austropuccinia psidii MF-1]|uniref:Uncharacterized protein n=1 Tax=Austropuccinia psidii MF-1 TaxID=1389203 RepID=A0A9Q3I0H4_9BASI|nr:hypothetical protein [Austropuccinia psidii MF-1]